MNDLELRELLRQAERPSAMPAEFTDRVFRAMVAELELETAPDVEPAPSGLVRVRRGWPTWSWRPLWRPAIAIAATVALVVAATVTLSVRDAPSALAALQAARQRFVQMPAYHATTTVRANDDSRDPDFELQWQTEDWYEDASHWRTTFVSSTSKSTNAAGDFSVMSPELFGQYDADAGLFRVRPANEVDPSANPSFFFDPSLQWWSDGSVGGIGKPSDEFFEENCSVTAGTFAERPATRLDCAAEPEDLEIWLDDETGMILRLAAFDIVREIDSIELDPELPAGVFEVAAPDGSKARWAGEGPPPPEYDVPLGTEVSARHQIVEGRTAGLGIEAIVGGDLWLQVTRCGQERCVPSLLRVDARTGKVDATVDPPDDLAFTGLVAAGDEVWAGLSRLDEGPTMPAWVQRLDPSTNALVGERIETGTLSGGFAWIEDAIWTSSGRSRLVKIGPYENQHHSVARMDLRSGAVENFDLGANAMGRPVGVGNEVWVAADGPDPRDVYTPVYEMVALDRGSGAVVRRVKVPGWPWSPVVDGDRLYLLTAEAGEPPKLLAIDTASGTIAGREPLGRADGQIGRIVLAAGHLWAANTTDGTVMKIDPATLKVVASISTGLDTMDVAFADGSLWATNVGDGTLVRIDVE